MARQQTSFHPFLFLSLLFVTFVWLSQPAFAQNGLIGPQEGFNELSQAFGTNPADVRITAAMLILVVFRFLGAIFMGLTLFAGFKYMTAGGNEEKTGDAVKLLKNAVIGLVIVLAAWAITRFTIIMISGAINNTPGYLYYPTF